MRNKKKCIGSRFARPLAWSLPFLFLAAGVQAGESAPQDLHSLTSMSWDDLLNIQVNTTSRREEDWFTAPGVISVLSRREIESFGANNLGELLERMPSMAWIGSYVYPQNVMSIRGDFSTHFDNHVLILVNGRPIRDGISGGYHAPVYLGFPIDAIKQLEVIRGPGSVLYGTNAYSGVINIITGNEGQSLSVSAGSKNHWQTSVNWSGELGSWHVNAHAFRQDAKGWELQAFDEGAVDVNTATVNRSGTELNLNYGSQQSSVFLQADNGSWSAQLYSVKSEVANIGPIPNHSLMVQEEYYTMEMSMVDIGYRDELSSQWEVEHHVTFNYLSGAIDNTAARIFVPHSRAWEWDSTLRYQGSEQFSAVFGLSANYQEGQARQTATTPSPINKVDDWNTRAYGEINYWTSDRDKWILGAQVNRAEGLDADTVLRLGYVHEFNKRWGIKFLHGEAYRSATQFERYIDLPGVLFGESSLEPERVVTSDLQVVYRGKSSQFSTTFYRSQQKDLIGRDTAPATPVYINQNSRSFKGIELEGRFGLSPNLKLSYGLTYQKGRQGEQEDITLLPEWLAKVGLQWQPRPDLSLGLFDNYSGNWGRVPGAYELNAKADDVHNVSLQLRWNWQSDIEVGFYLTNLLDEDIYHPEFVQRGVVNTLPARGGQAVYITTEYQF